jgi:hypothetical protein
MCFFKEPLEQAHFGHVLTETNEPETDADQAFEQVFATLMQLLNNARTRQERLQILNFLNTLNGRLEQTLNERNDVMPILRMN